jgi:hypothetical protein
MDEGWVEQIRRNLESKSTEELLQIWEKNDRNEWSDDAFIATRRILEERGENPGPQGPPITEVEAPQAEKPKRPGCVTAFAILLAAGAILALLQQGIALLVEPYWDEGSTIGLVVTLSLAVIYVAIAAGLWWLKSWARIATIVLLGLSMPLLVLMLFNGIFPALIGLAVSGYCIYWFAANKQHFEPAI